MKRILPFGAFEGFSDLARPGTHYYFQGFTSSLFGAATMYSIQNKIDSGTVPGMGNIKGFAIGPGGARFAQDDAGNVLKEQTPGAYDFVIVNTPGGNGSGIMGDQFGNLLYASGASNNRIGIYDGTTWNDNYQSVSSGQHPMDTYEDLRLFGNNANLAVLFSDGSFNSAAFSLPSSFTIAAVKGGPTGILIGANFGYQGALILWDGIAIRSKTPWKSTKGQILSIEKYGENWLVKTQREVLITNGYTVKQLFSVFDDPLAFKSFDDTNVLSQQMTVINDTLIFGITAQANGPLTYEYGKMKPGLYLYGLKTGAWNYVPVATGSTIALDMYSVFADVNYNNRILIGYRDQKLGVNYIAALTNTPPTSAQFVSEVLGIGRPHYQRTYFGPTEKAPLAAILNLGILNSSTDPATQTFNVAMKVYDFKRQLWGKAVTNAALGTSHKNQLQVDGSSSSNTDAQVGDEVTILNGVNAGQIAHITLIANAGTNTETWTLDTTLTNATESGIHLNVQPFKLIRKYSYVTLTQFKEIYFDIQNGITGKQFLTKFVFDNIGANLSLEMQTSYFVFDDLGEDKT